MHTREHVASGWTGHSMPPADPGLPTMAAAIDRQVAEAELASRVRVPGAIAPPRLRGIRIVAHKPARRCLIAYDLEVDRHDGVRRRMTVFGKIRANRFGNSGHRQLQAIWQAGFTAQAADGISVPEPLGTVPALRMWLQAKVPGRVASAVLAGPRGLAIAGRIGAAAHKLHTAGVPADRRHTMEDELRILERCLREIAAARPGLARRLHDLIEACDRVGRALPPPVFCGSHRDFYGDQVLVAGPRLYLLDFDLYCDADPGLDIGNFIGHVAEQAVRMPHAAQALGRVERRLEDGFVALAGASTRWAVQVYAALTLARHVYLSTRVPGRAGFTERVLAAAESRVASVAAGRGAA